MGKVYNYDATSFIGGVAPEVQKAHKDMKPTSWNHPHHNPQAGKVVKKSPKKSSK